MLKYGTWWGRDVYRAIYRSPTKDFTTGIHTFSGIVTVDYTVINISAIFIQTDSIGIEKNPGGEFCIPAYNAALNHQGNDINVMLNVPWGVGVMIITIYAIERLSSYL